MAIEYIKSIDEAIKINAEYLNLENYKGKTFPQEIFKLKRLKRLAFKNAEFEEIPAEINKLSKLTHLYILESKLKRIPAELFELPRLTRLSLVENQIESIPEEIGKQTSLKFIHFDKNKIKEIPQSLKNNPNIQELDFRDNLITSFFDDLSGMASLRRFILLRNKLKKFPFGIYTAKKRFSIGVDFDLKGTLEDGDDLWNFVKRCQKKKLDKNTFIDYFYLAADIEKEHKKLSQEKLLQALNSKIPEVVKIALGNLIDSSKEIKLNDKSSLCVLAKTTINKTEIKKRLETSGAKLTTKIDDQTTHVLIAENIKGIDEIQKNKHQLISEQQLVQFLDKIDTPYILEENSTVDTKHIKELVMSMQDMNMALAVQLLEGGGVPENLITELFIVNRFCDDAKVRKNAKKLLIQKGSNNLIAALKKRKGLNGRYQPYDIRENITCYTEDTELDAAQIGEAMHTKFGIATGFILTEGTREQKLNLLNKLVQGDTLVIEKARINKFPEELLEFKQLRKLVLNFDGRLDMRIHHHYEAIVNAMPDLEELHMPQQFYYEENLKDLKPLTKLKKLKILKLEITDDAKQALQKMFPNCTF